jgi:hypothetical protein
VFVAPGSGNGTAIGDMLSDAVARSGAPIKVQTVVWCRYESSFQNYADQTAHHIAACYIAGWVSLLHRECPHSRIILVGYSSGTHPVLIAAGMSPPGSIHRIVLLGSSVSFAFDLRPALRATRCGIDSYYSTWDDILAMAEERLGTADGQWTSTAGRVGFRPCPGSAVEELYGALRQHVWQEGMGGQGGHPAWTTMKFLRQTLVPLVLGD